MKIRRYIPHADEGTIGCAFDLGPVVVGAAGDDAPEAIERAASLAKGVAATLEAHPELVALLPPQATMALAAVQAAAHLARTGKLPEGVTSVGPAAQRLVRSLLKGLFA